MEELNSLGKSINTYLNLIFKVGLTLVILSSFFLFTNLTTEIYDTPKFLVLLTFVGILLVLLMLKFTISGKVIFVRTPLDIPLLLLLAVGIVSTILSPSPYVSLLGSQLKIHGSLIGIITLVLFYFILVNSLKGIKEIKWLLNISVIAAQILAAVTLISYAGVKILPAPWVTSLNFTPTGSSFSTTAILALLIPFVTLQVLNTSKPLFIVLNSIFLLVSGLTIALTGSWATWIAALVGLSLTLFISNLGSLRNLRNLKPLSLIGLAVPIVVVALITILSFIPPMGKAINPIYTQAQNFPREIQLPFVTSWKISISAFRDSPFWGSGPSTYLFDFTGYKPAEFNASKFWNLRFDTPFNEYFQVLANLGGIGILALVSLTALFASSAYKAILAYKRSQGETEPLKAILAISGFAFFVILLLHASTLIVWIIGLIVLASFVVVNIQRGSHNLDRNNGTDFKSTFLRIAANVTGTDSSQEIRVDALPGVLLVISLALVGFTGFFGVKMALADYHHRLALNAVSQNNGITAYNELVTAEKLNPYNDLYRTDLAQTNFALANAIASAKGPTEASPAGSLTDQDKQNIQVLLSQSISEARTAVALSPKSVVNWEILAALYKQISGVAQNALLFSLDSYGRAIMQDPLNPNLRVNVGGVYYAIQNYDMAIRFFTDAINLKSDFANGYFNLSVALRDKGDLAGAQQTAEKLLTLLPADSPDYKTINDYIADLKSKTENLTQPPAAQADGALQQEELPKVMDLPKPEKIATPAAIKKPAVSPSPTGSPTP